MSLVSFYDKKLCCWLDEENCSLAPESNSFEMKEHCIDLPRSERISSNLNSILLLATYGLLTYDSWFKLLPNYFDAIGKLNTFEEENRQLEEVLCKLLEIDLCVLPFDQDQTWSFLTHAPSEIGAKRLHTATKYNVIVPFKVLVEMKFHKWKNM